MRDDLTPLALKGASLLLVLGVCLGAVLRLGQVVPLGELGWANATHAHSHTLYWGWAGLALFALFFERLGVRGRAAGFALGGVALVGLLTFGVFWVWGYARPGVVLSASSVVPFGLAIGLTWRGLSRARGADVPFLRAAVVFVALSYAAALSRVVLKVLHVDDPLFAALAVHGFLGTFGAFFTLGVMGLTVRWLGARGGPSLRLVLGFAGLFPWGSLLVVPGAQASALGVFFRVCAVLMAVPAVAWSWWAWTASRGAPWAQRVVVRSTALAWSTATLALALVALGAFQAFAAHRHAVILVVHLQTLGLLTTSVLAFLEARRATPRLELVVVHQASVGVLLAGLALATVWPLGSGLALAALGGALVVGCELVVVSRRTASEGAR